MRFRFTIPLAEAHRIEPKVNGEGAQSGVQSGAQSDDQSKIILVALAQEELSATELVAILGLKSKTGAFKRAIKDLVEHGDIEYTIPDKPSSRLQHYRITGKGLKKLNH